jgi:hypothetical protein
VRTNGLGHVAVTLSPMAPYYANADRAEPGRCFRMVSIATGYRIGSPTDCPEPVRWVGNRQVGKKRMRLWSCQGHVEGLESVRPISKEYGTPTPGDR